MRKLIVLLSFIAVLAPASVFASIYGILAGKVVDTDGKGIIGATVLVEAPLVELMFEQGMVVSQFPTFKPAAIL